MINELIKQILVKHGNPLLIEENDDNGCKSKGDYVIKIGGVSVYCFEITKGLIKILGEDKE